MSNNSDNDSALPFLGHPLPDWQPRPVPDGETLHGTYCCLEKLNADQHAADLYRANATDADGVIWYYLPYGPYESEQAYFDWVKQTESQPDPFFYAIIDNDSGKATGIASYLRLKPADGSIEVGHINYSPLLQNTIAATEAMYLMMQQAFKLGYRRYEWKCNALNARSCRAAWRLGFSHEGIFRQATVVKNRNRDTAWYSILDSEWPLLKPCFTQWLAPDNFDQDGKQRSSLSQLTSAALPGRNGN